MTTGSTLIVQALDDASGGLSASQLSELIGRHPGNVRRLLGQLREQGLVRPSPGGQHPLELVWTRTDRPAPPLPVRDASANVTVPDRDRVLLRVLAATQGRSVAAVTSEAIERYYVAVTGAPIPETPLAS